jgi:hypothetical protein
MARKRPLKKLFNKAKDTVKSTASTIKTNVGGTVKSTVKNVRDKNPLKNKPLVKLVKKGLKAGKDNVLFAPLIPYVPLMRMLIKKSGATPEKEISKLAYQFKSLIVDKSRFEENFENLEDTPSIKTFNAEEEADEVTEETEMKELDPNNVAGSTVGALAGATVGLPPQAGGAAGSAIQNIIKTIVGWLRNLKNKKEAGKDLNEAEELALKAGNAVDKVADGLNATTGGGGVFANEIDFKSLLTPILFIVIGFFVIKKFM